MNSKFVVRAALSTLAAATLVSCGADEIMSVNGTPAGSFTVSKGTIVHVTLQTVGPGAYIAPPGISSDAVQFIEAVQAALVVPAGPTQIFRFRASAKGMAVVTFVNPSQNETVVDTIYVR